MACSTVIRGKAAAGIVPRCRSALAINQIVINDFSRTTSDIVHSHGLAGSVGAYAFGRGHNWRPTRHAVGFCALSDIVTLFRYCDKLRRCFDYLYN